MSSKIKNLFIVASAVMFCALISFTDINAQDSTPTPDDSAVIISRADDFPDNNQIVPNKINENQLRSLEQKIDAFNLRMKELSKRINTIEASKETAYDLKQKRLLLNLDILSKAEARAQNLRKQLIDLTEKEGEIRTKIEQLEYDLRPEMIDRMVAFAGTLRPEELRDMRRKSLESEKTNLQNLLFQIQSNKTDLEKNVQKADLLVDKLRSKLEGEIDKALEDDTDN